MAEIKSSVITEISGRLGNIVFYSRNGKNFARKWVMPCDPRTEKQIAQRQNFARLVKIWQNMNPAERKSWINHPSRKGSAYNAFMSENLRRLNNRQEIITRYRPVKYIFKSGICNGRKHPILQHEYSLATTSLLHEYSMNGLYYNTPVARSGP